MRTYATAQALGTRSHQCDATAVRASDHAGYFSVAYTLLDGVGDTPDIAAWTRGQSRAVAHRASQSECPGEALRDTQSRIKDISTRAAAVVAVQHPGRPLTVAWCGDARAYALRTTGDLEQITTDHNMRQEFIDFGEEPPRHARHDLTSYLGYHPHHTPEISVATYDGQGYFRLVLATDGAYEPLEDGGQGIAPYLTGSPQQAADSLVSAAIDHTDGRADNATALVADITP